MTLRLTERRERLIGETDFELRAMTPDDGDGPDDEGDGDVDYRFVGHPAVFMAGPDDRGVAIGNPLMWGFYERIAPTAFDKSIAEYDQRMLIDHDTQLVVSRKSAGSLDVSVDMGYGDGGAVKFDSALDQDLSYVRDLIANLRNRNITGMSIGFIVLRDEWDTVEIETVDGDTVTCDRRTILEAKLLEGSAVTFPAYESTDAELAAVATAYELRGDDSLFDRHPKLRAMRAANTDDARRGPGETTRATEERPADATAPEVELLRLRSKQLAARYGLPA